MFKRMLAQLAELLFFLVVLFGFVLLMLVVGDGINIIESAKYYIWIVLPLLSFSLIIGVLGIIYKNIFKKNAASS